MISRKGRYNLWTCSTSSNSRVISYRNSRLWSVRNEIVGDKVSGFIVFVFSLILFTSYRCSLIQWSQVVLSDWIVVMSCSHWWYIKRTIEWLRMEWFLLCWIRMNSISSMHSLSPQHGSNKNRGDGKKSNETESFDSELLSHLVIVF